MGQRLLVAISGHGLGHLAQVAPVLNALYRQLPDTQLVLRTSLPRERLAARLAMPFQLQPAADDFGMLQHSAMQVDREASLARYRQLHRHWEKRVGETAAALEAARPDLILADVPYLTLAAAKAAGIPALALCSLNWLTIFEHYFGGTPGAGTIAQQMREAYASAARFLRCEPAMPMPELDNVTDIGLVAAPARERRAELEQAGWLRPGERLVLAVMGGIGHRVPLQWWPRFEGVRFFVPQAWGIEREDCHAIESTGFRFDDLLASSDGVITKPGYGVFVEAASHGIPILYVERTDDWPEQACLLEWVRENTHCEPLALAAQGVKQAVRVLREYLGRTD